MSFTPAERAAIRDRKWQYLGKLAQPGRAIGDERYATDVLAALMGARSQHLPEAADQLPEPVARLLEENYRLVVRDDLDKAALRGARVALSLGFARLVREKLLYAGNDNPTMGDFRAVLAESPQGPARAALECVFVPQPPSAASEA